MTTVNLRHEGDRVTSISPREREDCIEVSGGTFVRHDVGVDGHRYYRFVPATREIARRLLVAALRGEHAEPPVQTEPNQTD